MAKLNYETLAAAVAGDGVGIRCRVELEPMGGAGDKVFPASYVADNNAETKYAFEKRRVGGESVNAVVLDSVASQANRHELALLAAIRSGEISLPVVSIDFASHGLHDLGQLSTFEVSHRIYDAAMRDSVLDGLAFRLSDVGRAITEASPRSAAPLLHWSPNSLVWGAWDSTGPRGGRGSKFERTMTTEIVGLGAEFGVKTASRLDQLAIETAAGPLYATADGDWTLDPKAALQEKGKPALYSRGPDGKPGNPSKANHANVAPSIDRKAGGVTIDSAVQTTVLSFIALRKLRFPVDHTGAPITERMTAEASARTALAAIALTSSVLAYEDGYDLRSRCVLVATAEQRFELLRRGTASPEVFELDRAGAIDLLRQALDRSATAGLPLLSGELSLQPAQRLVDLVIRSRGLDVTESDD